MKDKKKKIGRKGVTGIEVAIIGAIALFTIVLTVIIPIVFLKMHLVRVVEIQYGYNNAGLALLTLLSDKEIYETLSLNISGVETNIDSWLDSTLKPRLDKLVPSGAGTRCYELSYAGGTIIPSEDCATGFSATASMSLPYGEDSGEITLKISTTPPKNPIPTKYCCYEPFAAGVECATVDSCLDKDWEIESTECNDPTICNRNRD